MQPAMNADHAPGPILVGLPGTDLDRPGRELLRHPAVGGVVLFTRNFAQREQLLRLVTDIRAVRDPRLLVCIDQEGGRVQRLRDGFTRLPPLRALGRVHAEDPRKALDLAYRHGRVMATEMLACGIDLSFAPVLDLDGESRVIGDRAFRPPSVVEELGHAYLGGMQRRHGDRQALSGSRFGGGGLACRRDRRTLPRADRAKRPGPFAPGPRAGCADDRARRLPGGGCTSGRLFRHLAAGNPARTVGLPWGYLFR
jgi:beta-N-acetylhexosaminidase